jgi:hypothetical protein
VYFNDRGRGGNRFDSGCKFFSGGRSDVGRPGFVRPGADIQASCYCDVNTRVRVGRIGCCIRAGDRHGGCRSRSISKAACIGALNRVSSRTGLRYFRSVAGSRQIKRFRGLAGFRRLGRGRLGC